RGGRGDGRPDRGDLQGRTDPGGGQGRANAQARQEAADAAPAGTAEQGARRFEWLSARPRQRRRRPRLFLRCPGREHRHRRVVARAFQARGRLQGPEDGAELARGDLREPGEVAAMNGYAIKAIYRFEMARTFRTIVQSIAAPVITTSLYFIVFGAAIGGRMASIDGVTYGAF